MSPREEAMVRHVIAGLGILVIACVIGVGVLAGVGIACIVVG